MIEGGYATPIVLAMTCLATNAKPAVVPVVLAMAGHTGCRQPVAIEIASVARIAFNLCMCGPERKFRRFVMIEANRAPFVLIVARLAGGSVPSGMDILNLVAVDAGCADPFVAFTDMAAGARDIAVRTLQRKPGLIVVERLHGPPRRLAMTIVAGFPETPLVRIAGLMTIEAVSGGIAKLHVLCVAAVASHGLVSVPKCEIRRSVVEYLAVEQDDVGISPFVIGVTAGAFLFRCIGLTSVKSLDQLTVGGNLFVACQA